MNDVVPKLTDFLDLHTLQEMQRQFAAVTGVRTSIRSADGEPILTPADGPEGTAHAAARSDYFAAAPIELDGRRLGAIVMETGPDAVHDIPARAAELARQFAIPQARLEQAIRPLNQSCQERNAAAINFLSMMANAIARLCYQEYQLRRRVEELTTIYRVGNELMIGTDLDKLLDLITKTFVDVMKVRAASLRLLGPDRGELLIRSVAGLSPKYLSKGPVLVEASKIDRAALNGETVYISNLATDPRVLYPHEMQDEGLVSGLVVGLIYRDRPVGVIRLYTSAPYEFSSFEVSLVRAIAGQAAAAIVNAELQIESRQAEWMQRQIEVARDVQRRMIPGEPPDLPGIDLAGLYTPCFELGGDFYDFIELDDGHIGLVVADVVGKGVAASLMMASVRSSLRAYAYHYRDIRELIRQVNRSMCRDTLASEFVTLFYGELAPNSLRLRYCNAGHNPPIVMRSDGRFEELVDGGGIVGAFDDATFTTGETRLAPGDLMLLYTDGLVDSMNFREERFEVDRVRQCLRRFADQPARQILGNIRWEVRKFTGLTPRVDDLTMVAMKMQ